MGKENVALNFMRLRIRFNSTPYSIEAGVFDLPG
jgi:hypothetical protein